MTFALRLSGAGEVVSKELETTRSISFNELLHQSVKFANEDLRSQVNNVWKNLHRNIPKGSACS